MGTFFDRFDGENFIILDGAMGTELQKRGLPAGELPEVFGAAHPEILKEIHRSYMDAGSRIIYANTFGANRRKLSRAGKDTAELVKANVRTAREAAEGRAYVALDIGPIGEMMAPIGTLSFADAYDIFKEILMAGESAGADLVIFETFADLAEIRTGILAARENTKLPVFATMTFEERGRTFTGCLAESFAETVSGLGVEALGVNCSLGPESLMPIIKRIGEVTSLPLIVKANAGLPDARDGHYSIDADAFGQEMSACAELGVRIAGGCCGTDPTYIRALKNALEKKQCASRIVKKRLSVCSSTRYVPVDCVRVIGERINPTGKKRFQQALREHDLDYVLGQAIQQADAGADLLDVNVGVPGLDEAELIGDVVSGLGSVTDLPLQIDSGNAAAVEAGLRAFAGKAIVNSVNGEESRIKAVLPVVKKYGAAVVGLTMDEKGIPETAEGRFRIAEKILEACRSYGIPDEDVVIDCLTLTVSASPASAKETLKALRMVKEKLGLKTVLGVSNISFGLPARDEVNRTFLAMAMEEGLDLPILNPNKESMMDTVVSFRMLRGFDPDCSAFITRFADRKPAAPAGTAGVGSPVAAGSTGNAGNSGNAGNAENSGNDRKAGNTGDAGNAGSAGNAENAGNTGSVGNTGSSGDGSRNTPASSAIRSFILKGQKAECRAAAEALLKEKEELAVINEDLIPALDVVGNKYETGEIFLPQLLRSAEAAQDAFEVIRESISKKGLNSVSKGKIILATVKGDIHDIGKNIVKTILSNYGYRILDLGRDVPPEKIVETAVKEDVKLVGLSALMTTTLPVMEETVKRLRESGHACRVMVGGAVLTPEYAKEIGADYYAKDAKRSADIAREVLG